MPHVHSFSPATVSISEHVPIEGGHTTVAFVACVCKAVTAFPRENFDLATPETQQKIREHLAFKGYTLVEVEGNTSKKEVIEIGDPVTVTTKDAELTVIVQALKIRTDPPCTIYEVYLEGHDDGGCWQETFGSREQLKAFLQGARAAASVLGLTYLPDVTIP